MANSRFTLIDIMRGIEKQDLINRLSPTCFTFFMGLIMKANSLGFKNPMDLTTKQAQNLGGGDTRQTVYTRRKTLCKVRIDGKLLIKSIPGNRARNSAARYTIDYDLLCCYNGIWSMPANQMLKKSYSDDTVTRQVLDSGDTILRSEEKREEERSVSTVNILTKEEAEDFGMLLLDFYPGCCNPNIGLHMEVLQQIGGNGKEKAIELVKQAKEEHIKYWEVMSWVAKKMEIETQLT